VIVTLRAGMKPCATFKIPNKVVNGALVDHTRRNTRGRLINASGTFLKLNFSSVRCLDPRREFARWLISLLATPLL
jgi:hypothetical protein